jgi:hypothetical protein
MRSPLTGLIAFLAMLVAASFAATATAGPRIATSGADAQVGTLSIGFAVKKFVVQGNKLLASVPDPGEDDPAPQANAADEPVPQANAGDDPARRVNASDGAGASHSVGHPDL